MYKCVMVVTLLYTCIGTEIGIEIGIKMGDMEQRDRETILPDAYCLEFVACRFTLVLWFRFFASHKKIF